MTKGVGTVNLTCVIRGKVFYRILLQVYNLFFIIGKVIVVRVIVFIYKTCLQEILRISMAMC